MITYKDILPYFSSVKFLPLGSTPARVNRRERRLQLNSDTFPNLSEEHKLFVVLHELGHVELDTSDEEAVDKWASDIYMHHGHSLSASITALTHLLNEDNREHMERARLQLDRARAYDFNVNGNKRAYDNNFTHPNNPLRMRDKKSCGCGCGGGGAASFLAPREEYGHNTVTLLQDLAQPFNLLDSFEGCQPGEKPRQCRLRIKVESKAVARENRSEGKRLKGEAKATLAEQGIAEPNGMSKFKEGVGALGGAVGTALKGLKGGGDDGGAPDKPNFFEQNKIMIIGGIVAVVLIIGGILIFKK